MASLQDLIGPDLIVACCPHCKQVVAAMVVPLNGMPDSEDEAFYSEVGRWAMEGLLVERRWESVEVKLCEHLGSA